jgi:hypothetical protein
MRKVSMWREIVVASEVRVKVPSPRASPAHSCASRTARRYRRRVAKRARNELGTRRRSYLFRFFVAGPLIVASRDARDEPHGGRAVVLRVSPFFRGIVVGVRHDILLVYRAPRVRL